MINVATAAHVEPLPKELNASIAFERLKHLRNCIWLDSALAGDKQSRYSFLVHELTRFFFENYLLHGTSKYLNINMLYRYKLLTFLKSG